MKAILFFVAAGIVSESDRSAANEIATNTGKKVVFRNRDCPESEKPEANEGVAGKVPPAYAKFDRYDDSGELVTAATPAPKLALADRPLNALGLPAGEGCPEDRDALKEALTAEGIPFHGNAKTDALVDLYLAHFYPEPEGEG